VVLSQESISHSGWENIIIYANQTLGLNSEGILLYHKQIGTDDKSPVLLAYMPNINLRKNNYPQWKADTFIEVFDEVAESLLLAHSCNWGAIPKVWDYR